MKRTLTISAIAITSFVIGAWCMYVVTRPTKPLRSDGWISIIADSDPMGYETDALVYDVPTPKAKSLTGRVKFVSRDS